MKLVLTSLILLLTLTVRTQSLPDSIVKKIDHLFEPWDHPNTPGCTVGIVRNDSLIFAKGYGMANLEYDIPNTPGTIYHIASLSKQFTSFSIVLLARQGRLRLDDDIHKYLPWFPDLKEKITIRHLLNHTSGIRDQWQLLAISGTQLNDVITQDHIIKLLSRQQALNFKPGDEYNYCNSGYTMASAIVQAITGQTLRQFTDSALFKPLGMTHTHFHDDAGEVVKGRSYSYWKIDSTLYANSILSYSNAGATSLFTNINDFSKWIMNFYDHKVGDQQDIDVLTQKGRLNNGKEIDYALGIGVIDERGHKGFAHNGADAGYRTVMIVFPDIKMGFIVFSNEGHFVPGDKAIAMAHLFMPDNAGKSPSDTPPNDPKAAEKRFVGDYIADDGEILRFRQGEPSTKYSFSIPRPGDTLVSVPTSGKVFTKFSPLLTTEQSMAPYAGTYYCPELECRYSIIFKDHSLVLTNIKYNDIVLGPAGPDHFFTGFWAMHHIKMLRDGYGKITGFEVNSDRVQHLRFNKL